MTKNLDDSNIEEVAEKAISILFDKRLTIDAIFWQTVVAFYKRKLLVLVKENECLKDKLTLHHLSIPTEVELKGKRKIRLVKEG